MSTRQLDRQAPPLAVQTNHRNWRSKMMFDKLAVCFLIVALRSSSRTNCEPEAAAASSEDPKGVALLELIEKHVAETRTVSIIFSKRLDNQSMNKRVGSTARFQMIMPDTPRVDYYPANQHSEAKLV